MKDRCKYPQKVLQFAGATPMERMAMRMNGENTYCFAGYTLDVKRGCLHGAAQGEIELRPKSFAVLRYLIENAGRLVSKEELLQAVWSRVVVADESLTQCVSEIRRAVGDGSQRLIKTVPRRGYRFNAPVSSGVTNGEAGLTAPVRIIRAESASDPRTNLPSAITKLLGRENELVALLDLIAAHRLVTLTGAGGIGKTQLGVEAARLVLPRFSDGVWLAELAPLEDPALVTSAIARAIGVAPDSTRHSAEQLAASFCHRHLLLVIDNCEHLIDAVARIAETLLRGAPHLHILATSQEPLEADGEHVFRVHPLTVPPTDIDDIEKGLAHSAVQLFAERAQAADQSFTLDALAMTGISKICRHLDGNPLAIELAAGCVAAVGLDTLASHLEDRFQLLKGGRRSALQRHRTLEATLEATLDWSYGLLTTVQQAVLRRIAIFAGSFTLDGASAVAASDDIDESQMAEHVAALVKKSLVAVNMRRPTTRYRLLDTTRVYARGQLTESGDFGNTARRHASYYRALLEKAEANWQIMPTSTLIATYAPDVDDIRAALDRAFQPEGDPALGVALAVALAPSGNLLSMMGDCRAIFARALTHLSESSGLSEGFGDRMRHEIRLQIALAVSSWAQGAVSATVDAATLLALAEEHGDVEHQRRALSLLWRSALDRGDCRASLAFARRVRQIDATLGAALIGISLFHHGEYAQARSAIEGALAKMLPDKHPSLVPYYLADWRFEAKSYLPFILWTQDFTRQAVLLTKVILDEARTLNHAYTRCLVYAFVCFFAALTDDVDTLEKISTVLAGESDKHGLGLWRLCAVMFKGVTAVKRGGIGIGLDLLRDVLDDIHRARLDAAPTFLIAALADALAATGRVSEAVGVVQRALDGSLQNDGNWRMPEFLRLRGEFKLRENSENASSAERDFEDAIALSAKQGARSWQLRAALSLARLLWRQGRSAEACGALKPIYDWFTEGFDTADLKAARALLEELRQADGGARARGRATRRGGGHDKRSKRGLSFKQRQGSTKPER
jgi:predicted ATPase/DNA-binding winged helix-turn-helix (wHTH) protein